MTLNQKLALGAFGLGLVALFARPERGSVVTLDTKELAQVIGREDDHVTASELAAWIVEGRSDYRLIDVRSAGEFAEYHIPTAENVPIAALPDHPLLRTEKIVLYSEGGIHGSQGWMLLRAKGFKGVYTLRGGLEQWKEDVLFPTLAENAAPQERARFERSAALARFFGGQPRVGTAAGVATTRPLELPKLEAAAVPPSSAPAGATAPRKAKKKEGC